MLASLAAMSSASFECAIDTSERRYGHLLWRSALSRRSRCGGVPIPAATGIMNHAAALRCVAVGCRAVVATRAHEGRVLRCAVVLSSICGESICGESICGESICGESTCGIGLVHLAETPS
jgi:hypothetical protein